MKKGLAIFEIVCTKAVCFITFAFAFAFAHWAGKYTHAYPLDYAYETIFEYADSRKTNIAILAAVVLILFLAGKLFIRGEQEKKHKIVKIIALVEVGLIGGSLFAWVLYSNNMPYWDTYEVYLTSLDFMAGNYERMPGYMDINPQQYGLTFLYEVIFTILRHDSYKIIGCLNVICIMLIIYFGYRLTDEWFHNETVNFYHLVGSLLFFPLFLYSTYVYGDVMSASAGILALWAVTRWCSTEKKRYIFLLLSVLSIGTLARKNTLIMVIAVALVLAVHGLGKMRWQAILMALLVVVMPLLSMELVKYSYELRSGQEIGTGIPAALYIAMGMQQDGESYGMYSGYNTSIYVGPGERNPELSRQIGLEYIEQRLKEFRENKAYAREFYRRKLVGQWNDPTFSSLNNTAHFNGEVQGLVKEVYYGSIQEFILSFMERYIFILYCGAAAGALYLLIRKKDIQLCLSAVVFIGGVLFSILWEAKGRYVLAYVVMLIPYAALGIWEMQYVVQWVVTTVYAKLRVLAGKIQRGKENDGYLE